MDNQTESEPIYPVILKPRDLDYNNEMNQIILRRQDETEAERLERES